MLILNSAAHAQWVNSPDKNTLFVTNTFNPINISSVEDQKGGIFIFWEDNLRGLQSDVTFLHVNGDGVISFRSDGKKVSESDYYKSSPICTPALPNSAYVIWKEKSAVFNEQLVAQRVSSTGALLWNSYGVPVSTTGEIGNFAAVSDKAGRLFVAYTPKDADKNGDYTIQVQVFGSDSRKIFPGPMNTARSVNKKSSISLLADGNGGVFIFWFETLENYAVLHGRYLDASGKLRWGNSPLAISSPSQGVFSYTTKLFGNSAYVVWQTHKSDKDVYHQLISNDGKELWQKYGLPVTQTKGNQTNPQVLINDDNILLSWSDDGSGDRNILLQKFNKKGDRLWNKAVPVISLRGDQFGQKILSDGKKGAIVTWIDRRVNTLQGNIYAQRINENGKLLWDPLGVLIASSKNTEKSYVSVIPDITGGAVVIFKEKRNGKNEIFGQKIFNTGTFVSQIVAFNTELKDDSIKISWYSANESGPGTFSIERTTQVDTLTWKQIGLLTSDGKAAARFYEFTDKPDVTGTLFYRIVHTDKTGTQPSELSKIMYLGEEKGFFVSQNSPNPFRDKTVISINMPEASEVKMEFFDSHLEKVKEIEKNLTAGINQIEFSAAGLKPGIYFYKVYAGDNVEVKKMVITN